MNQSFKKNSIAIAVVTSAIGAGIYPNTALAQAQIQTPPSGAILNQLNQNNGVPHSTPNLTSATVAPFSGIHFVGDDSKLIGLAEAYQRQFIGKKVTPEQVIQEINAYVQKEHGYAVTFLKAESKADNNTYGYIDAIKYDGVKLQNSSKLNSTKLLDVLNYKMHIGKPVDVAQLERNTTIASELPGVVNQYGMVPGQAPNSTALGVNSGNEGLQTGYLGLNNEGNDAMGKWQTSIGVNANNAFGNGERLTFNGQLSEKSQYGMLGIDLLGHPSGTRISLNASALDYSFHSTTISNSGFTYNDNKMTGYSNSYWLEALQPLVRTETDRINATAGFAYKTNVANSTVIATTIPNGQQPGGVATQGFNLNDNRIEEGYIDLAGASGFSVGNASYDVKYTHGNAKQFIPSGAAGYAQIIQSQYGSFNKLNLQGVFNSLAYSSLWDTSVAISVSAQLADHNLVSAEQMFVGGAYQMRGWAPQILGGADVAYLEIAANTPITSEWSTKLFIEGAEVKTNITNYYSQINGTGVSSANGNSNFISDAGVALTYKPQKPAGLTVTGTLAGKFGKEPSQFGVPIIDNSNYRAWLRLVWVF